MIDYKISQIKRYDDVTEVWITIFKGSFVNKLVTEYSVVNDSLVANQVQKDVYERTQTIGTAYAKYTGDIAPTRDERNTYLTYYLNEKLGQISKLPSVKESVATFQSEIIPYGAITVLDYSFTKL